MGPRLQICALCLAASRLSASSHQGGAAMRLQSLRVDERYLRELRRLLANGDAPAVGTAAASLTPSELADLLVQLGPLELARLETVVGADRLADAVAELDPAEAA